MILRGSQIKRLITVFGRRKVPKHGFYDSLFYDFFLFFFFFHHFDALIFPRRGSNGYNIMICSFSFP